MKYIYGDFTDKQILEAAHAMHSDIHKLLLYKDNHVTDIIFENDDAFILYFQNLMHRFGGTKTLFNDNGFMVSLMSTLQAAYNEVLSNHFDYKIFRKEILDSHGYIKAMFEGGDENAKSFDS